MFNEAVATLLDAVRARSACAGVSVTMTLKLHELLVFAEPSTTVQVTALVPSGNVEPEAGVQ